MPTYSYECKTCGNVHDKFHGISAKPRVRCEKCGKPCRRLFGTGAGIIFKGSGFYETDYKTKRGTKPPPEKKTEVTSSTAESGKKTESTSGKKSPERNTAKSEG